MTPHHNLPPARSERVFTLPVHFESTAPESIPLYISATPLNCGTPAPQPRLPMGNRRRVKEPAPKRHCGMNLILLLESRAVSQKGGW